MAILAWVLVGMMVGAIAHTIMRDESGGLFVTMPICIVGAFLGAWFGNGLTWVGVKSFTPLGLLFAIAFAFGLIYIFLSWRVTRRPA